MTESTDRQRDLAGTIETDDENDTGTPSGGEVSEVGRMDSEQAQDPISDDQSVAGAPTDESGETDEGPTGPNARTGD